MLTVVPWRDFVFFFTHFSGSTIDTIGPGRLSVIWNGAQGLMFSHINSWQHKRPCERESDDDKRKFLRMYDMDYSLHFSVPPSCWSHLFVGSKWKIWKDIFQKCVCLFIHEKNENKNTINFCIDEWFAPIQSGTDLGFVSRLEEKFSVVSFWWNFHVSSNRSKTEVDLQEIRDEEKFEIDQFEALNWMKWFVSKLGVQTNHKVSQLDIVLCVERLSRSVGNSISRRSWNHLL